MQFTFLQTVEARPRYLVHFSEIGVSGEFEVSHVEDYFRTIRSIREEETLSPDGRILRASVE